MCHKLYQKYFDLYLSPSESVLLQILMNVVGLLPKATLGNMANYLPLPINAASRLKRLQRFLDSKNLCKEKIWWQLWAEIIRAYYLVEEPIILAIDRTSWRTYNLLVVSWIIGGRAIPINWQLLDKLGSSNLEEQQSVIAPISRLVPNYQLVLLGDREFCSKDLATWLLEIGWGYCLRLKKSTYVRLTPDELVTLHSLASRPGVSLFLKGVNISKMFHKLPFNLAVHYPKQHHGMPVEEGWFLLTTFGDIQTAVQTYATRFQLEEMFRDYKSYGFNLELTQLTDARFNAWFLLLTLVYSALVFTGFCTTSAQQKYLVRPKEPQRKYRRASLFTLGKIVLLTGFNPQIIDKLIERYIRINRHKIEFYFRGMRAIKLYPERV